MCRWLKRINCGEDSVTMQIESIFFSLLSGFSFKSLCHGFYKPALHEVSIHIIVLVVSQLPKTMTERKGKYKHCNEFYFAFELSHHFLVGLYLFSFSALPLILAELSVECGNPGWQMWAFIESLQWG